jgi:hypothetical protein
MAMLTRRTLSCTSTPIFSNRDRRVADSGFCAIRVAGKGHGLIRRDAAAQAFDRAMQWMVWGRQGIDGRPLAGRDAAKKGFAKIADRIPVLRIDDGEQRLACHREFTLDDIQRGDLAVAGRAGHGEPQITLSQRERRPRRLQLGFQRLGALDCLPRLARLQAGLLERDFRS